MKLIILNTIYVFQNFIYIEKILVTKLVVNLGDNLTQYVLKNKKKKTKTTLLNIFLFEVNFNKSTIILHLLLISSILVKFLENQISTAMSSINDLICKFL